MKGETSDSDTNTRGKDTTATVRDVAAAAGVSVGTVSRYLNGYRLRAASRKLVEKAISETGYRRLPLSSKPRTRSTLTIGTVFPRFDEFHMSVLSALDKILFQQNYHMVTSEYEGDEGAMSDKLRLLKNRYADGIVWAPVRADFGVMKDIVESGIPLVTYNSELRDWGCDHVKVDDREAVRRVIEHLIDLNHRRIAIISGSTKSSSGFDRVAGYRDAIDAAGIRERTDLLMTETWGTSETKAYDAARRLMESARPPTAIFASHYRVAYGVLRYIHDEGLRIPEDLSFVSFDDTELFHLHRPAITAIRQPADRIAEEIATLLFRKIEGKGGTEPITRVVRTELILRESVTRAR